MRPAAPGCATRPKCRSPRQRAGAPAATSACHASAQQGLGRRISGGPGLAEGGNSAPGSLGYSTKATCAASRACARGARGTQLPSPRQHGAGAVPAVHERRCKAASFVPAGAATLDPRLCAHAPPTVSRAAAPLQVAQAFSGCPAARRPDGHAGAAGCCRVRARACCRLTRRLRSSAPAPARPVTQLNANAVCQRRVPWPAVTSPRCASPRARVCSGHGATSGATHRASSEMPAAPPEYEPEALRQEDQEDEEESGRDRQDHEIHRAERAHVVWWWCPPAVCAGPSPRLRGARAGGKLREVVRTGLAAWLMSALEGASLAESAGSGSGQDGRTAA